MVLVKPFSLMPKHMTHFQKEPPATASYLDMPTLFAYTVGMKSMQYTIRGIPPELDRALRERAKKTGKSLNVTARETLMKGSGISNHRTILYRDVSKYVGTITHDKEFDDSMEWMNNLPNKMFP